MYKWEGEKIASRKQVLNLIMDKVEEMDKLTQAIELLKAEGKIDSSCGTSTYIKMLYKLNRYKQFKEKQNKQKIETKKLILDLRSQGYSHNQIAKKVNKSYTHVQNVCAANKKEIKKPSEVIRMGEIKAKKIIDYWRKYSYEGQVMTKETKKAFELLGLKPD